MAIPTRLFNAYFNIYRIIVNTSSSGMYEVESSQEQIVVASRNIKGRLSSGAINQSKSDGALTGAGQGSGYIFKLFLPSGTDIKVGDKVIKVGDWTERYYVDFVNKSPGGLVDHHIECTLTSSSFMVAS